MKHERKHAIGEKLNKLSNIKDPSFRHNLLDPIPREQIDSPKKEHKYRNNPHTNNDNLHNFSLINTSKTKASTRNKEKKDPEIKLFQIINI